MTVREGGPAPQLEVYEDAGSVAQAAADRLLERTLLPQGQVDSSGLIHLVLTGGGVGTKTLAALAAHPRVRDVDWARVHLWWGDERFLPEGDPERNETGARTCLLDALAPVLPSQNIHYVPRPDEEGSTRVDQAARLYAEQLARFAPEGELVPSFDVVLLGVGPDGHVASLFPGGTALLAAGATVGVEDSPKPQSQRVSLTLAAINQAREVWLIVSGDEKAAAVASAWAQTEGSPPPAARVHGCEQTLWLMDEGAASKLSALSEQ